MIARLSKVANVATVAIAAVGVGVVALRMIPSRETKLARQFEARNVAVAESLIGATPKDVDVVRSRDSTQLRLSWGSRGTTLVMMFKPGCAGCEATKPHWREVVARLPFNARAIALAPAGSSTDLFFDDSVVEEFREPYPGAIQQVFPVPIVPATLVVVAGRVKYAHIGELSAVDVDTLETLVAGQAPLPRN